MLINNTIPGSFKSFLDASCPAEPVHVLADAPPPPYSSWDQYFTLTAVARAAPEPESEEESDEESEEELHSEEEPELEPEPGRLIERIFWEFVTFPCDMESVSIGTLSFLIVEGDPTGLVLTQSGQVDVTAQSVSLREGELIRVQARVLFTIW